MAQTAHEKTSVVLTVPYHASTDQILGDDATNKIFDLVALLSRGQIRAPMQLLIMVENLSEEITVDDISFKDSPDAVSFGAVADMDITPAVPIVPLGRSGGRVVLNGDSRYLQVLSHHQDGAGKHAQIRLTLSVLSGGHPIE